MSGDNDPVISQANATAGLGVAAILSQGAGRSAADPRRPHARRTAAMRGNLVAGPVACAAPERMIYAATRKTDTADPRRWTTGLCL